MAKITTSTIESIIAAVGGGANIEKGGNCMTHLRLSLANTGAVDEVTLKAIPGVLGIVESDQQLQVILGPGKAQQAAEMLNEILDALTFGEGSAN